MDRPLRLVRQLGRRSAVAVPAVMAVLAGCATEDPAKAPDPVVRHGTAQSGEAVYANVCAACHATGVDDAPELGDRDDWEELIEEGQAALTAHAWVGVRKMPARGGREDLTLEEFSRAVAYMARAAGGDWTDPDERMLAKIRDEERKRIADMRGQPK